MDNFKARFGKNITLTLTDLDINYEKSKNTTKPKDKNILELINYLKKEIPYFTYSYPLRSLTPFAVFIQNLESKFFYIFT